MFKDVTYIDATSSTMDEAASLIRSKQLTELHGTVIVADRQSQGRGRHGRRWLSSAVGDLMVSFVLTPRTGLVASIPILGALATSKSVDELGIVESRIKWPNDVLVDGRKVAGVIAESVIQGADTAVVLGIGVNLVFAADAADDFPVPVDNLSRLAGSTIARDTALEVLCRSLSEGYEKLDKGLDINGEWKSRLETLGHRVVVRFKSDGLGENADELLGVAEDVDELGRLMLRQGDGHLVAVSAGDVSLRNVP